MDNSTLQNVVQVTSDYDQFKLIDANRNINRPHVEAIKASFVENGNFTKAQPVLINEKLEVIDGQHRLIACKELGEPVFYTMVPGLRVDNARKMNILHRQWRGIDYLKSYAREGRKAYTELLVLHEEYPTIALSTLLIYASGHQVSGYNRDFRSGDTQQFNITEARNRLDNLEELCQASPAFATKPVALALLQCMRSERYDQARMVRKVAHLAADLKPFQNVTDNLRQLEDIYNHQIAEANRVRFY